MLRIAMISTLLVIPTLTQADAAFDYVKIRIDEVQKPEITVTFDHNGGKSVESNRDTFRVDVGLRGKCAERHRLRRAILTIYDTHPDPDSPFHDPRLYRSNDLSVKRSNRTFANNWRSESVTVTGLESQEVQQQFLAACRDKAQSLGLDGSDPGQVTWSDETWYTMNARFKLFCRNLNSVRPKGSKYWDSQVAMTNFSLPIQCKGTGVPARGSGEQKPTRREAADKVNRQ